MRKSFDGLSGLIASHFDAYATADLRSVTDGALMPIVSSVF